MTVKRRPHLRGKPSPESRAKGLASNARAAEIARTSKRLAPAPKPARRT